MRLEIYFLLFFASFLNAEECGIVKAGHGLSIGGEYSEPGQWPWLASLFYKERYYCGSTIISKNHLLSAAHCIIGKKTSQPKPPSDFYALLGRYDLNNNSERSSVKKNISQIFIHPEWDTSKDSYDADIAILLLSSQVTFNNLIQPICLPNLNAAVFNISGTVAGYGISERTSDHNENKPMHVKIKTVDHAVCLFKQRDYAVISSLRMFCAGELGKNPCKGDSGSAFMVESNHQWTIIGIVSAAASIRCNMNHFTIFTQVPVFMPWILNLIKPNKTEALIEFECVIEWRRESQRFECWDYDIQILTPNMKIASIDFETSEAYKRYIEFGIKAFGMINAKVFYLPDFSIAKTKFPSAHAFFINNCGLKRLDKEKLALLPQIVEISFSGNEIKELPENVFDDLVNLEGICLDGNQIKVLPQKLLWNLPKLKEFWMNDNEIEVIPARFFKSNHEIEKIIFQRNKIKKIGSVLRPLNNLNFIDFRWNDCISLSGEGSFDFLQNLIDGSCS